MLNSLKIKIRENKKSASINITNSRMFYITMDSHSINIHKTATNLQIFFAIANQSQPRLGGLIGEAAGSVREVGGVKSFPARRAKKLAVVFVVATLKRCWFFWIL